MLGEPLAVITGFGNLRESCQRFSVRDAMLPNRLHTCVVVIYALAIIQPSIASSNRLARASFRAERSGSTPRNLSA